MSKGVLFGGNSGKMPNGMRPSGGARIRELLGRDLAKYFLTGLPALLFATVYGFGVWLGLGSASILMTLLFGLVGGILAGPFICGLVDTIFRTLRDEPGFWRVSYRKALKQCAVQGIIAGGIFGAILAGQIFCLHYHMYSVLALIGMAVLSAVALYSFAEIALVKLGFGNILRNALVLMLAHPLLTIKALAVIVVWALLLWVLAPLSVVFWAVGGLWLPLLFGCFFLYEMLDETFSIEEGTEALQNEKKGE